MNKVFAGAHPGPPRNSLTSAFATDILTSDYTLQKEKQHEFSQQVGNTYPRCSGHQGAVRRPLEASTAGNGRRRRRTRATASGAVRYGRLGTYSIRDVGVFQRPAGGAASELLYPYLTAPRLPATLDFVDTARRAADLWFREELEREALDALAHARRR